MQLPSVREISPIHFNKEDTLVVFGEVFSGGYISGLIDTAQRKQMNIIYSTVGRRDQDGSLRPLHPQEKTINDYPFINIPLEAGFDMEKTRSGSKPVDLCQNIKLKTWPLAQLDKNLIESAQKKAEKDFRSRVSQWLKQLDNILPDKGRVLIAHTMAGGVPRTKIILPILNRVLRGLGERFVSSKTFWDSDLGWFCSQNFNEVTAQTYHHLIELSARLREKLKKQKREIYYTAYSYHGTEVLQDSNYLWQSYSPYLQGFAKKQLEDISKKWLRQEVNTCIFNVPEILTKSSAVFPGVEIPLYSLLGALKKDGGKEGNIILSKCLEKLVNEAYDVIMSISKSYFTDPQIQAQTIFKKWPQHNNIKQMEMMIQTSKKLFALHKDPCQSITPFLSEVIFNSCGRLIMQEITKKTNIGVSWINHDIIARDVKERGDY